MASEFIEVISPNAKTQIEMIMGEVDKLADKIRKIPEFKLSNSPSGADDNIKKLTADLALQAKEIDNLKNKLAGLNQEKQKSATLTTQQKVDNAIILKQEKQQATLTSAYADAYAKLNTQRTIAKTKLQDEISAVKQNNAEIRKAQKEFDVLNKKVAAADKAVGRFSDANRKINGLASSVGNLMAAFGVTTGLYLFANIAKDIYQVTKQLQSLDLALKMVSGSQEEFANNQSFLKNLAEQYGIEIKGLTKNFTEFWVASKGKLEAEQIKAIFTSISKSVAVMGLSVEQQDSAFLALQQMMSKGTVQAEELKKQLGNALPGAVKAATMAYQALHPELKVTEKLFMEQMKAGKVLSSELLPELAKAYEKLYGIENVKRAETLQAAQERLANSWTDLVRSMNESETGGISMFFKTIIDGATDAMKSIGWLNDDWDKLLEKSMGEGRAKGDVAFEKAFMKNIKQVSKDGKLVSFNELGKDNGKQFYENAKGQLTEEQITLKVLNESRQKHIELKEEELKLRIEWQRLVDEGNDPVGTKRKLERLYKEIGTIETVIGIARQRAGLDKASPKASADTATTKAQIEAERKSEKDRLKAIEDSAKIEYDLKISNLEKQKQLAQDEIDLANAVTQNKEIQYQDVIDATKYYNGFLIAIEKAKYDEEVRLAGENSKEKEIAYNKWFISTLKLSKEMAESLLKVTKDFAKEGNDVASKMLSDFEENAKKFEEIDKRMKDGKADNDKERLESQRRAFNEFMGNLAGKSGFGESFDLLGQINPETGKTIMGDLLDTDDKGEKAKAYFLAVSTVAQDAMNAIDQADEERYQRRLARLDKEEATALKYAGDGAAAKAKIEADFDKKRKELEIKEWKRKQKVAIVNIAIDTAQAAMASWKNTGFPWAAAAAIAMGAIQIGIVASQKMPEYFKGTDNAEAGLAWTQERGAEIVLDKHNRVKTFGSDGGAQLTMLDKGDKVKTADQTKKLMFDAGLNSILSDNGIKEAKIEIINKGLTVSEMREVMMETLGVRSTQNINFDKNGFSTYISKNGNITRRNEDRGSGIGITL